jgi:putative oxidoreductase
LFGLVQPGKGVNWGNWQNFAAYTNTLLSFLSHQVASVMGLLATIAEILIRRFLIIGYKTRVAGYGGFLLTLIFVICMAAFIGIRVPLNYSVFSASAGSLLLAFVRYIIGASTMALKDNKFKLLRSF